MYQFLKVQEFPLRKRILDNPLVCGALGWEGEAGDFLYPATCTSICLSIHLSYICPYFRFRMITWVIVNGFSQNLVCALILWRSAMGLRMGKFLPTTRPYIDFWMITLENINGFSPNLVCALLLWTSALGLLIWANFIHFVQLSARNTSIFYFQDNNLSKSQWVFNKFDMCIDIVEISFGTAHCQILSVICPRHDNGGVLSFHILFPYKTEKDLFTSSSILFYKRKHCSKFL